MLNRSKLPSHLTHPRLLLVEDDDLLRDTLLHLLQHEGFHVTEGASGEEAEKLIHQTKPPFDIIITDLVMPGKSGLDVLAEALKADPNCTVLLLTGFGNVQEAAEAMEIGAYDFVTKPMQLDQFRRILQRLMERSALVHERDELKNTVAQLQQRIEHLEATKGRLEMLAHRMMPAGAASMESPESSLEDLERLAGLHIRGLLSDEEFGHAKKALLARWLA